VTSLLRSVIDPELGADIVSLGMVPVGAVSDDGVVTVGVKLTIGGMPAAGPDQEGRGDQGGSSTPVSPRSSSTGVR
jgi:hypothetical protein